MRTISVSRQIKASSHFFAKVQKTQRKPQARACRALVFFVYFVYFVVGTGE